MTDEPTRLAESCADALFVADNCSAELGMKIISVAPGRATLRMTVRDTMLNGHRMCHGGLIFTLADSAFAFACNTYNQLTVASGADINFVAPAYENDVLTAVCEEQHASGRTGVYDTTVTNQKQKLIACFRGRSYRTRRPIIDEND